MKFKSILICGSSHLAFEIARFISDVHSQVIVLERKISTASTMEYLCRKNSISYIALDREGMTRTLFQYMNEPVLIINAVNYYIFPPKIVEHPNATIINYHNSLLPLHRGMHPEAWQIFEMDKITGITWHYINNGIDSGPIISQRKIALENETTSITLLKIHNKLAFEAFKEVFNDLLIENIKSHPQSNAQIKKAKKAIDIPGNGMIDIGWNAEKIYAFLRAMDYGPLNTLGKPYLLHNGKQYFWKKYRYEKIDYACAKNEVDVNESRIKITCNGARILLDSPQIDE